MARGEQNVHEDVGNEAETGEETVSSGGTECGEDREETGRDDEVTAL
jgi:hypothetical protein